MGSQSIDVMKLPTTLKLHTYIFAKLQTAVVKLLYRAPKFLCIYQNCVVKYQSCSSKRHTTHGVEILADLVPLFSKMDYSLGRKGREKKTRTHEKRRKFCQGVPMICRVQSCILRHKSFVSKHQNCPSGP
jgi:hypothetical protein